MAGRAIRARMTRAAAAVAMGATAAGGALRIDNTGRAGRQSLGANGTNRTRADAGQHGKRTDRVAGNDQRLVQQSTPQSPDSDKSGSIHHDDLCEANSAGGSG